VAKTVKGPARKPKALSVHLGLNAVSATHYEGWGGELAACEFDAHDMAAIAKSAGMKSTVLLTKQATRAGALAAVRSAAKTLASGDLLLLTYSGHGGQIPDVTGEEDDKLDETWCLYDGQLIDDEMYLELGRFAAGVRIVVLSDSCHSGTVLRAMPPPGATPSGARSRMMPPAVGMRTYREHQAFYDKLQRDVVKASGKASTPDPDTALAQVAVSKRRIAIANDCKASVILISGCQDNQTSMDGDHNGAFTEQLLRVWDHGKYQGNYAKFHAAIKARMPPTQVPNLFTLGPVIGFVTQRPFSV
jgi:metacaspase-1